jgi:phosphatidylglycerophosphatase A
MSTVKFNLRDPVHFFALGFGSGLITPAPGTWGTLAGVPVYLLLVYFFSPAMFLVVTGFLFFIGIYLCGKTASDVGVHDHGSIVWDEIVGLLITMAFVTFSWSNLLIGFVLFRIFDIAKPWPIKWLDKHVHGGLGIMLDDVLAGVFAAVILVLLQNLI